MTTRRTGPGRSGDRPGFHGYRTFILGLLVVVGYFAGYFFGQAAAVVGGVSGLLVGLAALVAANEGAAALKERARTPTVVSADVAEVSAETAAVEGSPVHVHGRDEA